MGPEERAHPVNCAPCSCMYRVLPSHHHISTCNTFDTRVFFEYEKGGIELEPGKRRKNPEYSL